MALPMREGKLPMNQIDQGQHGLRLLSLDGGGIRGLSELVILEELMERIKWETQLPHTPIPAEIFDLIGGTSTGGLIALLLGRLLLLVAEAIDTYDRLAERVFSETKVRGKDGTFKATKLEEAIKDVVTSKLGPGRENELMLEKNDTGIVCKTFVCAVPALNVAGPRLFRTYEVSKNKTYNCTIWEAARATSAAPTFFKRIKIGSAASGEDFIDAGLGCNNPVKQLVAEAELVFGKERPVDCILSVGAGQSNVVGFNKPEGFQRLLPVALLTVLSKMATDSERTAEEMELRYSNVQGLYFRLNVEQGLQDIALDERKRLGEVRTHTIDYLRRATVDKKIDHLVKALTAGLATAACKLENLGGVTAVQGQKRYYRYPSTQVSNFIQRPLLLQEIEDRIDSEITKSAPQVVVLIGMGGSGKTQLALEICRRQETNKQTQAIFWVDASTPGSLEHGFERIAKHLNTLNDLIDLQERVSYVKDTLGYWTHPWLIVFDNFDTPDLFQKRRLQEYFPRCKRGTVIVTSRDAASARLGHKVSVGEMSEDEGVELLFHQANVAKTAKNIGIGQEIVRKLGGLALAVDQAGAYISARNLDLSMYIHHYEHRKKKVLQEVPKLWEYQRKLSDREAETSLSVFTTFEMSFDQLHPNEVEGGIKAHLLILFAFFNNLSISEQVFQVYAESRHRPETEFELVEGLPRAFLQEFQDSFNDLPPWLQRCCTDDEWDSYEFQDVQAELHCLSLLQNLKHGSTGICLSLHPLVQDWLKLRASPAEQQQYTIEAIMILSSFLNTQNHKTLSLRIKQEMIDHLDASVANDAAFLKTRLGSPPLFLPGCLFASFYNDRGRFKEAIQLYVRALEGSKIQFGPDHQVTLRIMSQLAINYSDLGRFEEAEALFSHVIKVSEEQGSAESLDLLKAKENLGNLCDMQGRYAESGALAKQTLEAYEKKFGPGNEYTLTASMKLAVACFRQNHYAKAEELLLKAISDQTRFLGPTDPGIMEAKGHLAIVYDLQGRYREAEKLYREVLKDQEERDGPEHPDAIGNVINLGIVLTNLGDYRQSQEFLDDGLQKAEKVLGVSHATTLDAVKSLADLAEKQGLLKEAEKLYERALTGREELLGHTHPETQETATALSNLRQRIGN